jgi:hypothetical protein
MHEQICCITWASLISLPAWLRSRALALTPLIPSSRPQPFLCAQLQLSIQLWTRFFSMDEIAEAASHTALTTVQTTTGFSKIGDGRQFAVDGPGSVPSRIESITGLLGTVLVLEAGVDIANQIYSHRKVSMGSKRKTAERLEKDLRSLLLSQTTTSSISPNLHISHQKSS